MESTPVPPGEAPTQDIAVHHEVVDPGPSPLMRAALGLLVGAATGAVAVLLTRNQPPQAPNLSPSSTEPRI